MCSIPYPGAPADGNADTRTHGFADSLGVAGDSISLGVSGTLSFAVADGHTHALCAVLGHCLWVDGRHRLPCARSYRGRWFRGSVGCLGRAAARGDSWLSASTPVGAAA